MENETKTAAERKIPDASVEAPGASRAVETEGNDDALASEQQGYPPGPATRAWLTPRTGARVSVLGGVLVILALPLPWFPPQQGLDVVLWLTLGGRSGWGWIGVGTVIAALISQVSALQQPGLPKPSWGHAGLLLVTLYCMGVLPGLLGSGGGWTCSGDRSWLLFGIGRRRRALAGQPREEPHRAACTAPGTRLLAALLSRG